MLESLEGVYSVGLWELKWKFRFNPKNGKVAYAGLGRFTGNKENGVYRSELTPLRATLR